MRRSVREKCSISLTAGSLGQLVANSDLTSAELGEKVGLSASAAHRRVGQIARSRADRGVSRGAVARGRGIPTVVMVNVTLRDQRQETMAEFENEIARRVARFAIAS